MKYLNLLIKIRLRFSYYIIEKEGTEKMESADERIYIIENEEEDNHIGMYIKGERRANEYIRNAFYLKGIKLNKRLCTECLVEAKDFLTENLSEEDSFEINNKEICVPITVWFHLERKTVDDEFKIVIDKSKIEDLFYQKGTDENVLKLNEKDSSITFLVNILLGYVVDDNPMIQDIYLMSFVKVLLLNNFKDKLDSYINVGKKAKILEIYFNRLTPTFGIQHISH